MSEAKGNYEYLQKLAKEIKPLASSMSDEVQGTVSAKRRVFKIFLQDMGLYPAGLTIAHLQEVKTLGFTELAEIFDSILRLREYAASEQRRQWNPGAKSTDGLLDIPFSFDWYVNSSLLPNVEEFDFLSRAENIYKSYDFKSPGLGSSKFFDTRLRVIAGSEDGLRLVMTQATV